jgi:Raf kinase inhibitor-like YbhB/YbcL family protein
VLKLDLQEFLQNIFNFTIYNTITMTMKLTSTSFIDGGELPTKYTCDGEGISPDIQWTDAPSGTKSFVLIYDDPDAVSGIWDHWVLYNLPATTSSIPENAKTFPAGTQSGLNSWPKLGHGAACPPPGTGTHRYIFHLYALNAVLDLPNKANSTQITTAMKEHVLEKATLTGLYKRKD